MSQNFEWHLVLLRDIFSQHTHASSGEQICSYSSSTDWSTDALAAAEQSYWNGPRTQWLVLLPEPLQVRSQSTWSARLCSLFLVTLLSLRLPVICTPWCVRVIWKPCPHRLCTTLSASNKPRGLTLACKYMPSWEKGSLVKLLMSNKWPGRTFGALPRVPQVLHTD